MYISAHTLSQEHFLLFLGLANCNGPDEFIRITTVYKLDFRCPHARGLGGLVVSALDFQAGYRGFEARSGRDNFQTIITPSSYSTCPGLSIKWTGRRLVTYSGTKCAWVIHESKAVQIHVHHSNRRCLYVPRVPCSVKNPHNILTHRRDIFT